LIGKKGSHKHKNASGKKLKEISLLEWRKGATFDRKKHVITAVNQSEAILLQEGVGLRLLQRGSMDLWGINVKGQQKRYGVENLFPEG